MTVVVIGAGPAGLAAALELRRRGTTVRVASTAGFGTTWTRPGSMLNDEIRSAATGWEIAYAALFFMSEESVYINAQTLAVDSGITGL